MSDPLGLIGASGASRAASTPAGGVPADPNAPSFKDLLMKNIEQVNQLQQDATRAIEDLTAGKRADVEGVLLAAQKADSAFRLLQGLRNKVMQAYDEIQQIRV